MKMEEAEEAMNIHRSDSIASGFSLYLSLIFILLLKQRQVGANLIKCCVYEKHDRLNQSLTWMIFKRKILTWTMIIESKFWW